MFKTIFYTFDKIYGYNNIDRLSFKNRKIRSFRFFYDSAVEFPIGVTPSIL